ncbi:MAG: hypothetical protein ACOVLB_00765 [Candidatus Nanopelagicus sp.]
MSTDLYSYERITVRPSTDVEFYKWTAEFEEYVKEHFTVTGKRLSNTITYSEDMLTETRTSVWASFVDWIYFCEDITCFDTWNERDLYESDNNIVAYRNELEV